MTCPRCKSPMHLARNDGGMKTFACEYCSRRISRRDADKQGYGGRLTVQGWMPGAREKR